MLPRTRAAIFDQSASAFFRKRIEQAQFARQGICRKRSLQARQDYQGALAEADGKRAKITKDEAEAKKVKEVIGQFQDNPELHAMIKLARKVDNHFKEFKTTLEACPRLIQKCYEDTKNTVWSHIWNPQGEEGFEIVEGPELFTQCMLELYQCYEVFNLTSSYSKAKEFRIGLQRDEEAKSALESQYKLRVFEILKDNFKDEHQAYEAFVKDAKTTPEGREELKEIWGSLSVMGQNVFQAKHAEIYQDEEKPEDAKA